MLALDATLLVLAVVASGVSAEATGAEATPLGWVIGFGVLVLLNLAAAGAYRARFVLHFRDDARKILAATAIAAMAISFVRLLLSDEAEIASQASRLWLFTAAYLTAGRGAHGLIRARARRFGQGGDATLVIGAGAVGQSIARRLMERPEFGLKPVAFLDDQPLRVESSMDLPVIGTGGAGSEADLGPLTVAIRERQIKHVILAFSLASYAEELALVRRCMELGVSVSLVPRLFEGVPDQTRLERIGGIPLISVHPADPRAWQFKLKYALDRALSLVAIVLLSPLMAIVAAATMISPGRPILFRQERVGLDGRAFQMLKFRTMRGSPEAIGEADADWAAASAGASERAHAATVEERSSRLGRALRRASLDELPQLFNVVRGEMSLVGPRPERRSYVELFERSVDRYTDRHRVKSGLTGWAQVHGLRGETSLADRIEWDNYYIENWSPWLDIKILALTVIAVFHDRA